MRINIEEDNGKLAFEVNLTKIIKYTSIATVCCVAISKCGWIALAGIGIIAVIYWIDTI